MVGDGEHDVVVGVHLDDGDVVVVVVVVVQIAINVVDS